MLIDVTILVKPLCGQIEAAQWAHCVIACATRLAGALSDTPDLGDDAQREHTHANHRH